MCGIPASGKSSLARKFQSYHSSCRIVSRDEIRFSIVKGSEEYFQHEGEVFKTFCQELNKALKEQEFVVADVTHITTKSRKSLLRHLNLENVYVICFWVEVSLDIGLERNANRVGIEKVPEEDIKDFFRRKTPPQESEIIFDDIYYFNIDQDIAFSTVDSVVVSIDEALLAI